MVRRFLIAGCAVLALSAPCIAVPTAKENTATGKTKAVESPKPSATVTSAPKPNSPPVPGGTIATTPTPIDGVVLSNQMMITFMERMKGGNLAEARNIALQMINGNEKYVDTPEKEYRSFSTIMGKTLYEMQAKREGRNAQIEWVLQPIADGFYFMAMVDYQEGKMKEALDNIQKAISWDPVRAAFHVERGFLMLHQKGNLDLPMVLTSYLKALELADNADDFATALRGVGYVMVERGDLSAGYAAYVLAKRFDPADKTAPQEMRFIEAQAPGLSKILDQAKSIDLLRERKIPVAISRAHLDVLLSIAGDLTAAGKTKELKAILKQALSLDPTNPGIIKKLTELQ
ncbi:MAG: tetratricopeptide repeat protein [Candidatus Riflebacteria bacterium]|nr:tetratricopeptide repeat protein [Candidatus Riflebacteria bacterium]